MQNSKISKDIMFTITTMVLLENSSHIKAQLYLPEQKTYKEKRAQTTLSTELILGLVGCHLQALSYLIAEQEVQG